MKKFKVLLCALSLLTVNAANAGELVLDSFNYDPALDLTTNSGVTFDSATVTSVETGALAEYELTYTSTQPGSSGASANVMFESNGKLSYDESPDADGELLITYSLLGGGTLDFTGYNDFFFDVTFIDGVGGFDVELTLVDDDGTQISATYSVLSTGRFLASLASLAEVAPGTTLGFDFSKVLTASAFITSDGIGNDFALDAVGLVPEPSALAILGLGLIGLGLSRRKLA